MIEWAAFSLLIAGAAFIPKKTNDKRAIKTIFENIGYGVKNKSGTVQFPTFKKQNPIHFDDEQIGMSYIFKIPLGLPASKMQEVEKNMGFFSDGLSRPVLIEYKSFVINEDPRKYLNIKVFNKDIPDLFPYKNVPECPKNEKGENEWVTPLGKTLEGLIWHNFDQIPMMTVAGTTRFGKTVFLKVLMTYLIENHPDDVEFYIIDLKGGLEFARYENLKQVKMVATNAEEAYDLLFHLTNKQEYIETRGGKIPLELGLMEQEYKYFRKNKWSNILDTPIKTRKFVIVDEAAQLAPEKWMDKRTKECLGYCQFALSEITRIGGALGYREVFCTQYPTSDTLPRQIKQNSDGKVTFRLPSGYASDVAIDEHGAEKLPSNIKGRGLYKTHELQQMQVPYLDNDEMWSKLEKYQEPVVIEVKPDDFIEQRQEKIAPRKDTVKFG